MKIREAYETLDALMDKWKSYKLAQDCLTMFKESFPQANFKKYETKLERVLQQKHA